MKMASDGEWDKIEIPTETQALKTIPGIQESKSSNKVTIDPGCVDKGIEVLGDIARNKPNVVFTVQKAQEDEPAKPVETTATPTSTGSVTYTYNTASLPYATDIYAYQQLTAEIAKTHKLSAESSSKDTIIAMKDALIVEKNNELNKLRQDVIKLTDEVAALRERVLFASALSNVGLAVTFSDLNTVIHRPDGK